MVSRLPSHFSPWFSNYHLLLCEKHMGTRALGTLPDPPTPRTGTTHNTRPAAATTACALAVCPWYASQIYGELGTCF